MEQSERATLAHEELAKQDESNVNRTEESEIRLGSSRTKQSIASDVKLGRVRTSMIGAVVDLMSRSQQHRRFTIRDVMRVLVPPIETGQCYMYRQDGKMRGFVSWAWFADDVERSFVAGTRLIQPSDWQSGTNLWLIDFIAPHGHAKRIVQHLSRSFPGQSGKALRYRGASSTRRVSSWRFPASGASIRASCNTPASEIGCDP